MIESPDHFPTCPVARPAYSMYSSVSLLKRYSVYCADHIRQLYSSKDKRNVERIIELVMIRDNMLQLSSNVFSLMDIRDVIFFMYKLIAYLYVC